MINWIAGGLVALVVGLALRYIIKQKKKGVRCVGCSESTCTCMQHGSACSGCLTPPNIR